MPPVDLALTIRESGLVSERDRGVVMVSGGPDSTALLLGLCEVLGSESLVAFHVNYGLRPEAAEEEALVRRLCERLGVEIEVYRAERPEGNTQAWARGIRHRESERIRSEREFDWIAVGHSRSDLVETFLYRLATSPGTRSLLAMPPRSGRVIRPLIGVSAEQIREGLSSRQVEFALDSSNDDPTYARNRIRLRVVPELKAVNPGLERNIVRTRAELEEDEALICGLAAEAMRDPVEPGTLSRAALAEAHPAIRRRMIRQLAEDALARPVAVDAFLADQVLRLVSGPEGGTLDLGQGDSLLVEAGLVRVASAGATDLPGRPIRVGPEGTVTEFSGWRVRLELTSFEKAKARFGDAYSAFMNLSEEELLLRSWEHGDRIDPLGMEGSKKIQDVFSDAHVPASKRRTWPLLLAGEVILWVPGLVRSRHFLIDQQSGPVLHVQASPPADI